MPKPPAFQFYAAEYLADARVQMLSLAQEGIYIRLLSYCWREGSLPTEDAPLRLLAKNCPVGMLAAVKDLFTLAEDGRLIHGRLEQERVKQAEWRLKSSNGGKKGAEARAAIAASTTLEPPLQPPYQPNGNTAFASAFASSTAKEQEQTNTLAFTAKAVPAGAIEPKSRKRRTKEEKPPDPRHESFRLACQTYAIHKGAVFAWDGFEGNALARLLAAAPDLTLQQFQGCLNNRARSPGCVHSQRPGEYLPKILSFLQTPLNQFKQPEGTSNGEAKGKSGQTVDAARAALQILADRFGANADGDSPAGPQTIDGRLPGVRGGFAALPDGGHHGSLLEDRQDDSGGR